MWQAAGIVPNIHANGNPGLRRTTKRSVGKIRKRPDMVDTAFKALHARLELADEDRIVEINTYGIGETVSVIHAQIMPRFGHVLVVTHPKRYPTWDEIAEARYQLIPDDVMMVLPMPPSDRWVNLHPNSFVMCQVAIRNQSALIGLDGKPLA